VRRALLVAFHFAPENTSGTHRSLHFARGLADAGVDVTVLTRSLDSLGAIDPALSEVFPWPDRIVRVAAEGTLLGRVGPALRRLGGSRRRPGAATAGMRAPGGLGPRPGREVGAVPSSLLPSRPPGLRGLVDRVERLPDVHKGWRRPALRAGRELFRWTRYDVVIASGPPWTGLRVGAALARRHGVPFVADFRDPWTLRSGRTWPGGGAVLDRIAEAMEARVVASSALVISNSPGITAALRDGHRRLREGDAQTILNGSDARRREEERPFPARGGTVVRHFGSLYAGRRLAPVLRAARSCGEAGGSSWRVEQYGSRPVAGDLESVPGTDRGILSVHETLPFREAVDRMHEPGLLLVIQPPLVARQVPTKLYDYLCTGNPVLLLAAEDSAAWEIARRFDRCRRADPDDAEGIARVLSSLRDAMRRGELRQVDAREDTARLTKESVREAFLRSVERGIDQAY
jgi:hypothetical protein